MIIEMVMNFPFIESLFQTHSKSSSQTEYLFESIVDFLPKVVKKILPEMDPAVLSTPLLENMPPVYGQLNPSFRDYIAPALVLAITYAMSVGLTALAFVQERMEGILERTVVSGVLSVHIFFAHFIVEFVMMLIQTVVMLIFLFKVFGVTQNGSLLLVITLTLVQGEFKIFQIEMSRFQEQLNFSSF